MLGGRWAALTTVLLVRHADIRLPPQSADPPLSVAGRHRAEDLANIAGGAGVTTVLTSEFLRTIQTVEPLATRLGLVAREALPPAELAAQVKSGALGRLVVVAGHSNTVPEMIEALGVSTSVPAIGEREFDNLFVVTVVGDEAKLLHLRYGRQSV